MSEPKRLIDHHDAALFDLDGVVYLGPEAVAGVPTALAELRAAGTGIAFVTNNAARPPAVVVEQLNSLGIPCENSDVVTSAQAIAAVMAKELPAAAKVLVVGTQALADEVTKVGLRVVDSYTDSPAAVVQGYDPKINWHWFDEAAHAIQHGARWFVSNTDINRPTNLGMVPGAGAQMNIVATAVTATPTIAGKPCPPLLAETVERVGCQAPIFVGDRLDTDIEGANNVSMASLMVFTGAHGKAELVSAPAQQRPTTIGHSVAALLKPMRTATQTAGGWASGDTWAGVVAGEVALRGVQPNLESQLDALWALAQLAWENEELDLTTALDSLDLVR